MARPCKSASVLTDCSQTKSEIAHRQKVEERLRGDACKLTPPKHLNANQKKIFAFIVQMLEPSGILGALDEWILALCCITIDRLKYIEGEINKNPERMCDKDLMGARDKYSKDFFRCCNELSLSPQSRAKLANLDLQKKQQQGDPLLQILSKGDTG